jgi:hypothetical protein
MKTHAQRNQPCPCGSGRKCKNCCYRLDAEAAVLHAHKYPDSEWERIRRTEGEIVNAVVSFGRSRDREDLAACAMLEFSAGCPIPKEGLAESIFIPWFIFSWLPAPAGHSLSRTLLPPEPLALLYLAEQGQDLDEYQKSFIQAACSEPFSFFLVTAVEPHQRYADPT